MARREKGEGSVSQRKDGTWTARLTLGFDSEGKRRVKAFYGKTAREVKRKLKEFQKELIKNDFTEVLKMTVQDYMENWLLNVKRTELKPSSYDRVEQTCTYQIFPFIGYIQIHNLSSTDIQNLINTLTDKGYSYSSIKKAYNAINACFTLAYNRGEIKRNPAVCISLPKQIQKEQSDIVFYDADEITLIEKYSLNKHNNGVYVYENGWYIILLLYTGLRIGELLALKWDNVNFANNTIRVSGNIKQVKDRDKKSSKSYKLIEQSPKTKSGNRLIPLADKAAEALKYLSEHRHSDVYVAATKNGKPISARNIDRTFRRIIETAGIQKPAGVHSLRHTFASMLFKRGVDVKTVSEILGHSDVTVTYNIYIHIIEEQKSKAISLLNQSNT